MQTVEEALAAVLAKIEALPGERVPLLEAQGRVLLEDVVADIDNPPFDNSAVDGYAVRAADTAGASAEKPILLQEIGEVPAGQAATEPVTPGTCARVMTGAPMPEGADAMVMVEDTQRTEQGVAILQAATAGDHVRLRANDIEAGRTVLTAGTRIGAAEIAMLAAVGQAEMFCVRRPRVAVFSTGDELVDVSLTPGAGQIRDTNRFMLAALVREAGGDLHSAHHLPDDPDVTEAAFRACAGLDGSEPADVVVTSGGVSVGDRDFVKPALEKMGRLDLWRVRMKPGKPLAFGYLSGQQGDIPFFGLPGNPVSTMVTFELFVRPALWKMMGRTDMARPSVSAVLTDSIDHIPGRREYIRASLAWTGTGWEASSTGAQGSGVLTSLLGANALLIVPEDSRGLKAGDTVEALVLGTIDTSA